MEIGDIMLHTHYTVYYSNVGGVRCQPVFDYGFRLPLVTHTKMD